MPLKRRKLGIFKTHFVIMMSYCNIDLDRADNGLLTDVNTTTKTQKHRKTQRKKSPIVP